MRVGGAGARRLGQSPAEALSGLADVGPLAPWISAVGPLAVVDLETSGLAESRSAEILEVGIVLVDGAAPALRALHALVKPRRPVPAFVTRLTGLRQGDFEAAPEIAQLADEIAELLRGRTIVAHNAEFERHFLTRFVSPELAGARYLDTLELLSITHPDAPDMRLESFTRLMLGSEERHRALDDALDTLRILLRVARCAQAQELRYRNGRRALERHLPESPWLALLGGGISPDEDEEPRQFIGIAPSPEPPVPFDEDAIAAALGDLERGRRHFEHYRVRPEQIELARHFCRNLRDGGTLLLEGGTGVGKSLAYLAAAIPFAVEAAERGERQPLLISTRTKLLQDQLLEKDIAAAARLLGHSDLRALSIKGRANYVCEKRLGETLAATADSDLFQEDRICRAVLVACARTRPAGEVGSLPAALHRRHPQLADLVRRSVAQRAEQCSREECGRRPSCPFGRRRRALARAHLVVANHDLLLRWPPDYPGFSHVIVDEGHELAGVADDVYALMVRPDDLLERVDEIFGAPQSNAADATPTAGLLPPELRLEAARTVLDTRRALALDLVAIGRNMAARASDYGEVQLPEQADRLHPDVARLADAAAGRLDALARLAEELDERAQRTLDEASTPGAAGQGPVRKNAEALREAARGLRTAFSCAAGDVVAAFERLVSPYDRWLLAIRSVSPASDFHERFLQGLESFAAVSASLFVGGDAFAAIGELEIEERSAFGASRIALASPFDYEAHMRVVVLREAGDLVRETAATLALLARELGGRTLGLFTSLRRMHQVAEILAAEFAGDDIEILAPRRASDDPAGLVRRFCSLPGGGVLLGARTFWQGLDIMGDDLQAVVIEKLPFEVPTELRRRREERLREAGLNAFERFRLGKMLLYLKQMTGRLIRSETDRGIVVIVEGRADRGYFAQLHRAFPEGSEIRLADRSSLPAILAELELRRTLTNSDSKS